MLFYAFTQRGPMCCKTKADTTMLFLSRLYENQEQLFGKLQLCLSFVDLNTSLKMTIHSFGKCV